MARFMPQDLFDSLAITYLMSIGPPDKEPMTDKWEDLIRHYAEVSYQDESYDLLRRDLIEAAAIVKKQIDIVEDPSQYRHYFERLKALSMSIHVDAKKKRPFVKRIFGGTWLNYESKEPTGRIERCRQNVGRAIATALATEALAINNLT